MLKNHLCLSLYAKKKTKQKQDLNCDAEDFKP